MPHHRCDTIAVNDAASLVPIGPRRFRQLASLETEDGKQKLGLTYVGGRAHINREEAMTLVSQLRAVREASNFLPQENLDYFTERNERDPVSGARICLHTDCRQHVSGRGKLCMMHALDQSRRRAARKLENRR